MSMFTVTATKWEHGWELHIADAHGVELGVTQAASPNSAARMVRSHLGLDG